MNITDKNFDLKLALKYEDIKLKHLLKPNQIEMYENIWNHINNNSNYVIETPRQFGKTYILTLISIEFALLYEYAFTRLIYHNKNITTINNILSSIVDFIPRKNTPRFISGENILIFNNTSYINFCDNLNDNDYQLTLIDDSSVITKNMLNINHLTICASTSTNPSYHYLKFKNKAIKKNYYGKIGYN